ncbi:MAG: hypothetical protein IT222_10320 [Crocinitomix sp.]|nr:hypothetical protein [Crocinitomix sp.]
MFKANVRRILIRLTFGKIKFSKGGVDEMKNNGFLIKLLFVYIYRKLSMVVKANIFKLGLHCFAVLFMFSVILYACVFGKILKQENGDILWFRVILLSVFLCFLLVLTFHLLRMIFHFKAILILNNGVISDFTYLIKFPREIKVIDIKKINFYSGYRGIASYEFRTQNGKFYISALYFKKEILEEFKEKVLEEIDKYSR